MKESVRRKMGGRRSYVPKVTIREKELEKGGQEEQNKKEREKVGDG